MTRQRERLVMAKTLEHIRNVGETTPLERDGGFIELAHLVAHLLSCDRKLRLKFDGSLMHRFGKGQGICKGGMGDFCDGTGKFRKGLKQTVFRLHAFRESVSSAMFRAKSHNFVSWVHLINWES
jgi:hypothetical protein